jgi:hypothetical protein
MNLRGFDTGRAPPFLRLIHLIPPRRMTEAHIIRYRDGNAFSMINHWLLHNGELAVSRRPRLEALLFWLCSWLRLTGFESRKEFALHRARCQAVDDLRQWVWLNHPANPSRTA